MWWVQHRRWIKAPLRLIPIRRCMVCGRFLPITLRWWFAYIRWGVVDICSRKCADHEFDRLDTVESIL